MPKQMKVYLTDKNGDKWSILASVDCSLDECTV